MALDMLIQVGIASKCFATQSASERFFSLFVRLRFVARKIELFGKGLVALCAPVIRHSIRIKLTSMLIDGGLFFPGAHSLPFRCGSKNARVSRVCSSLLIFHWCFPHKLLLFFFLFPFFFFFSLLGGFARQSSSFENITAAVSKGKKKKPIKCMRNEDFSSVQFQTLFYLRS